MNIFLKLNFFQNNEEIKWLFDRLNVEFCAYTCLTTAEKNIDFGVESEGIYLFEDTNKPTKNLDNCIPVDGNILIKMKQYQQNAMDLVFRWRSSLDARDSYSEIKEIYNGILRYWNDFIITRKLELYLHVGIPHSATEYILFCLCRCHGIPTIIINSLPEVKGRQPERCFATAFDEIYPNFSADYEKNRTKYIDVCCEDIDLKPALNDLFSIYLGDSKACETVVCKEQVDTLFRVAMQRGIIYLKRLQLDLLLKKMFKFMRLKIVNERIIRYSEKFEITPNYNDRYVFFALHFQPEASTCPTADIFADLEKIAQIVSAALPQGIKLYVKEHPAYWLYKCKHDEISDCRSKEFYERLNALENINFIDHTVDANDLMENAVAVVTANGTIGWEAIFKKIPVILFGNSLYQYMNGVNKVSTVEECKKVFDDIISNNVVVPNDRDIAVYLKTLEDITYTEVKEHSNNESTDEAEGEFRHSTFARAHAVVNFIEKVYPQLIA